MVKRAIAWAFLLCVTALFVFNLAQLRAGTTPDSASYLFTALEFHRGGELNFPAQREPGYRVLILGLSVLVPWSDVDGLVRWVAAVQVGLYVVVAALLARRFERLAGVWGAAAVVLLFAANRFDMQWMSTVQSEAPSKLVMLFALWLVLGGWRRRWPVALVLLGLVPILRPSDVAVPLGALTGMMVWLLLQPAERRRHGLRVVAMAAVALLGPTLAYSALHGRITGFAGLSERSASHLTARILASTEPSWLAERGFDAAFLDEVARPLWEANSGALHGRVVLDDEFGRPSGLSFRYCPFPRREILTLAEAYAARRGLPTDNYSISAALQQQGNRALALMPPVFIACAAEVAWDYLRLPVVRAATSQSLRNRLSLAVPAVFIAGLVLAATAAAERRALALAMAAAALAMEPAYLVICGLFNNYMERLATHLWLPMALLALAAAVVARFGTSGLGRKNESC
jgi:hypothetical protein